MKSRFSISGTFNFEHRDVDGNLLDKWSVPNLITDEGYDYALDAVFNTTGLTTVTNVFYFIIFSGAFTPAVGSVYGSAGGTENTNYAESLRQTWDQGASSSQSVTNAAAAVITADTGGITVTGVGLVLSPTEDTGGASGDIDFKGDTACADGILFSEATASKTLALDETLSITYTVDNT